MLSCFVPCARGSGLRTARAGGLLRACRRWVHSGPRRFWPFPNRATTVELARLGQDPTGQCEKECAPSLDEPNRGTSRDTNVIAGTSGLDHAGQSENKYIPNLEESCSVKPITAVNLEKLVNNLIPSLLNGQPFYVPAFLHCYREFTTTQQVLDLLFRRYLIFSSYCEEDEPVKNAICTFLGTWLDMCPEEFGHLYLLQQLVAYTSLNMPASLLAERVHLLLRQLEDQDPRDSESKDSDVLPAAQAELEEDEEAEASAAQEPELICAPGPEGAEASSSE